MKNNHSLFQEQVLELLNDTKKFLQQESLSVKEFPISSKDLSFFPKATTPATKKPLTKTTLSAPPKLASNLVSKQASLQPPLTPNPKPALRESVLVEPVKALPKPITPFKEEKQQKKTTTQESTKDTSVKKDEFLALIPLEKPHYLQNTEIKRILQKIAPDLHLLDEIPDDSKAILKKEAWKHKKKAAEILILTKQTDETQLAFLQNIVAALEVHFTSSTLFSMQGIKSAKDFEALFPSSVKLIIAIERELLDFVHLLSQYKQIPSQGKSFLGEIPVLFIKPLHVYLDDPENKRLLWKLLCQKVPEILSPQSS
ncbi:MAG: hypothetical protein HKM07_06305 [Chlamydiae bacterium]|nr:hypothetical protein [Chlamydiota bacterium]